MSRTVSCSLYGSSSAASQIDYTDSASTFPLTDPCLQPPREQSDDLRRIKSHSGTYLGWNRLSVLSMLQDVAGQPAAHRQKLTESVCSPLICCVSAVSFHLQLEVKGQTPPYLNPTRPESKKWLEVTFTLKYCTVLKYFRCFHVWCWSRTHWLWRLWIVKKCVLWQFQLHI